MTLKGDTAPTTRLTVLDAAARLFDSRGYERVSIGELIAASGVSNGSIYHHFGSKEGVLSTLVIDALAGYQDGIVRVLEAHRDDARQGVRAAVAYELAWSEANRRPARLINAYRDVVAAGSGRDGLRSINRAFTTRVAAWLEHHAAAGAIPRAIDLMLLHAVVFAPARELASLWLAGRVKQRPTFYSPVLGDVAWAGICALTD